MRTRLAPATLLAAMCLTGLSSNAHAHEVMGTVFYVDIDRERVHLNVELPIDELNHALGIPVAPGG